MYPRIYLKRIYRKEVLFIILLYCTIPSGNCIYFISFRPKLFFTKLSKLLRHNIIKTLVVLGNVVNVTVVADGFKMATGTLNLAFFGAESPGGHCLFKSKCSKLVCGICSLHDFIANFEDYSVTINTCHYMVRR